jgi:hypothetical protein
MINMNDADTSSECLEMARTEDTEDTEGDEVELSMSRSVSGRSSSMMPPSK